MLSVPAHLLAAVAEARQVVALTGSGISAESGIPTFRDAQTGLWAKFSPEELATPEAFARDPALVWGWYRWRRELVARAAPNAGHRALVELAALVPRLTLVTQNVDGLHQRAGSRDVVEFHGNLLVDRCSRSCGQPPCEGRAEEELPRCAGCGALLRPGVVWFGEAIPEEAHSAAERAVRDCQVFFSIGTSSLVFPAAGLANEAQQAGATLIEINPSDTPLTADADFALAANAGVALPAIAAALRRHRGRAQ
jgi:NAD-dependent deacetylase